jgi:predicted HicB family RNase H-like nuclease
LPSTASRCITARIPNRAAEDLALVAAASGRSVSSLIAEAVQQKLYRVRSLVR